MLKRDYPGRLTFEQWRALPRKQRYAMAKRAQCDLLKLYRFCARKTCRRARSCGGDPVACEQALWRQATTQLRKVRDEYHRIGAMPNA